MLLGRRAGFWIRAIYGACLTGATYNHAILLIRHGIYWDFGGAPLPSAVFWTSLAFLDPLAVAGLFLRPRFGLALTSAIIVCDVLHNCLFAARSVVGAHGYAAVSYLPLLEQIAFLLFVAATIRIPWKEVRVS